MYLHVSCAREQLSSCEERTQDVDERGQRIKRTDVLTAQFPWEQTSSHSTSTNISPLLSRHHFADAVTKAVHETYVLSGEQKLPSYGYAVQLLFCIPMSRNRPGVGVDHTSLYYLSDLQ